MWSSTEENNYNRNSNTTKCHNKRLVSSSSSSSTSSSSPSPSPLFSPSSHLIIPTAQRPTNTTKTMEEVWKDINLSNQDSPSDINHLHSHSNFRGNGNGGGGGGGGGFILQDFLARPFNKDAPTRAVDVTAANICLFGSPAPTPPPHAPILSLNPGHHGLHLETPNILNVSSFNDSLNVIVSSSGLLPSFGTKRLPESDENSGGGDRRHKRMIKNRESAARSRARKQAYTNELELEVAHLMEENARLKRQQEQLCMAAAAAAQLPKKHSLHRTSTAPF